MEVEESVISKIQARRARGRKKYGTTMERTDLTEIEWIRHAQEEALDLAIYLERLIRETGVGEMVESKEQILQEQKLSRQWRKKVLGTVDPVGGYGWVRVAIP